MTRGRPSVCWKRSIETAGSLGRNIESLQETLIQE